MNRDEAAKCKASNQRSEGMGMDFTSLAATEVCRT